MIDVLLATYNGASFLRDQIHSIHSQSLRPDRLLVRDDQSTDGTTTLLEELHAQYRDWLVRLPSDRRLGCNHNFETLLQNSRADYIAFADQDDIWKPDKLKILMEHMVALESTHGTSCPIVVHSDLALIDESNQPIASSFMRYQHLDPTRTSVDDLVLQNVVTGCAMLFNRALLDRVLPFPAAIIQHDWWIALVAARLGVIGYEPTPLVLYRQHAHNVIGARGIGLASILNRLRELVNRDVRASLYGGRSYRQALVLDQLFGCKPSALSVFCKASIPARIVLLLRGRLRKHGALRQLVFILSMVPRVIIGYQK